MAPSNSNLETQSLINNSKNIGQKGEFKFIYKGTEYDCTNYAKKHPGGIEFFEKQVTEKKDITEYFLALHSNKATKILKSFPVLSKGEQSEESKIYDTLYEKVKHLEPNNYLMDFGYLAFVFTAFLVGCFSSNYFLAFIGIVCSQIVSGWLCHSWAHGREPYFNKIVDWYSPLVAGVSTNWWNRKHNLHHMFTNVYGKDEDIAHSYSRLLFGFLYLKWNFDSIMFDLKSPRVIPLILHFVFYFQQNIWVFLLAQYFAGFYSACILVGNHENEKAFYGRHGLIFLKHQLITSRDYDYDGLFWVTFMGGMQYQSVHHLFPKIPFYNLTEVKRILLKELPKYNLAIKTDTIM